MHKNTSRDNFAGLNSQLALVLIFLAAKAFSLRPAAFFIDCILLINAVHLNIYNEEQRRLEKEGFNIKFENFYRPCKFSSQHSTVRKWGRASSHLQ